MSGGRGLPAGVSRGAGRPPRERVRRFARDVLAVRPRGRADGRRAGPRGRLAVARLRLGRARDAAGRPGGAGMSLDAVWITGVGAATPLGNTYASFSENLLAGRSGVQRVTYFPVDDHPSQIAS